MTSLLPVVLLRRGMDLFMNVAARGRARYVICKAGRSVDFGAGIEIMALRTARPRAGCLTERTIRMAQSVTSAPPVKRWLQRWAASITALQRAFAEALVAYRFSARLARRRSHHSGRMVLPPSILRWPDPITLNPL